MLDVVAIGELLIDFSPAGLSHAGNMTFEQNPGGAPANVLAALAKLGKKTAFIGKVGSDYFGVFLKDTLDGAGINSRGLIFSDNANTTLAFVHLDDKGDRSFSFYRNPGADMTLSEDEIKFDLIDNAKILHFGSVSMTDEPSRSATIKAVRYAKEKGLMVSYDPNLRIPLWKSLDEAKSVMCNGLEYADLLKISEEELVFLTGECDPDNGSRYIRDRYHIDLIFITLGRKGCFYRLGNHTGRAFAYNVKTIDTTGAGDAFMGGILCKVVESGRSIQQLRLSEINSYAVFSNAMGSLATAKKGAIPAMPTFNEIQHCIANFERIVE